MNKLSQLKRKSDFAHFLPQFAEGFSYRGGKAFCEEVEISKLIAQFGSPLLIYSLATIKNRVRELSSDRYQIHYAVKANNNLALLKILKELGCGMDVVSIGEIQKCLKSGIAAQKIVFSGVGKTQEEITLALDLGVQNFNIESIPEFFLLDRLTRSQKKSVQVCIRVNPNIDAKTHPYIATGLKNNKFGLDKDELIELYSILKGYRGYIEFIGLSCHLGSQINQLRPFIDSWKSLLQLATHAPFQLRHLNLGGGIGISYEQANGLSLMHFRSTLEKGFENLPYSLSIEPGRSIIGPAAMLAAKTIYIKKRKSRQFLIIDAGMNDLIRPALYQAQHPIFPQLLKQSAKMERYDVVGPVCESADCFFSNAKLPTLCAGDSVLIANAGAYTMSMASQYNSRPRIAEVLVNGKQFKIIRNRESIEDLIRNEEQYL